MEVRDKDEALQLLRSAVVAHNDGLYYVASSLAAAYIKDMEAILRRERGQRPRD